MIKIIKSNSLVAILALVPLLMLIMGCGEDTGDNSDATDISQAPALPPIESMTVDLSLFNDGEAIMPEIPVGVDPAQMGPGAIAPASGQNFINAAERAGIISATAAAALAFPAGLFGLAHNAEPVEQADGSWIWSFSMEDDMFALDAKLTGIPEGNKTHWSMNITVDNEILPIKDFEWYTGISTESNTLGSWQIYDMFTPDEFNLIAKLDWSVIMIKGSAELAVENIDTRSDHLGDALLYSVTPVTASMVYTDASEEEPEWNIVWDIATGAGSLTVPNYNSGEEACWDAQRQDVQCN